ncbi:MAG: carnitine dehydratase [bacterium TMED88]|nr:carnitine dehydratase [Deltaproteobacteria bacterium]OUV32568.1 MAG: carnitine dehydratase [bacterium TMED88]
MGPLSGVTIIEIAGIGPGPFAGMMLSDMGADVIRVDRADRVKEAGAAQVPKDILARGRRSVAVDLKNPAGVETVLGLIEKADGLIEGFRPGVMERLGLGPEVCLARNPKLVFGRMTGWGQEGPLAQAAGHDINYIALTGALEAIGRSGEAPVPPLNLVGDFGGGGMLLAFGMACALVESGRSGQGQVVDAAMVDGASSLMAMVYSFKAMGIWGERGENLLDTGAHFYDVYETADGEYVSVGSIEPQFYALLLKHTGLTGDDLPPQMDRTQWVPSKEKLGAIFKAKTRAEWTEIMEGTDVCFAPVLDMDEAPEHPHMKHRGTFVDFHGVTQPAPAPRFDRTVPELSRPPSTEGQHTDEILADMGFTADRIRALRESKAIA